MLGDCIVCQGDGQVKTIKGEIVVCSRCKGSGKEPK